MDSVTGPRPGQIRPPRRTGGAGGGTPGPQGPPGPAGPAGQGVPAGGTAGQVLQKASATDYDTTWATPAAGAALAYRHVQSSAAVTWSITHNLSFRPNISAVDSTGREIWPGATDYTSATAVQLTIYGAVDLVKNELRNAVMQNLGTAPAAPVKGLMYFNSADNTLYWYDGAQWVAAKGAAGAVPADTVTTLAIGGTAVPGSSTLFSRGDHAHGMPAFGAITTEQTFGAAGGNGAAATIARSDHTHGNPVHDAAAHSTIPISALAAATANVNLNNFSIINLGPPSSANDAANKSYVDAAINGLSWKDTVRIASTANRALTGLTAID